ncbi:MAG: nucleotide exchange factor GrpE [Ruminococcaceae bacterium]|nr:nucleotide exchange factor GrpE [Oscillospiraceae bacterium]
MDEQKKPQETETEIPATEKEKKPTASADKKKLKKLEGQVAELEKQLEEAKAEAEAANDKYMRMMAEYDNFRKRSAKEKEGVYADAYADCIANILPILDNLERAAAFDQLEGLKKGLEMTAKAFGDALEKMGITEIETKSFDPNLHNAVMHVEDESLGDSEIVEVFQKGYCKGEKVIRYAMVKVAN